MRPRMKDLADRVVAMFLAGGWVMWPILALSLLSVALSIERGMFWASRGGGGGGRRRSARVGRINTALRRGDFAEARRLAEAEPSVYGWFAAELLERIADGGDAGDVEAVAVEVVEAARPRVERFSLTLSTIITAAPMLGIFGTVIGIIDSFRLLGARSEINVEPAAVAGGISVALYTTAFGLIVAMGALFPYVVFRGSADRCFSRFEAIVAAAKQGASKRSAAKVATARQADGELSEPAVRGTR